MKVLKILVLTAATVCAAVLLFAVLTLPPAAATLQAPSRTSGAPVVPGAFHVHTVRSDGTGTVDEVAAAAARAGLRFVVFTDHGDGTRPPDPPAYRSGVLCVDGVEIGTSAGHYAAVGMRPSPYPLAGEPRDVIEDVTRLEGFGVAAHPDSQKETLRWRDWAAPFDGIEWLNSDSQWRDKPRARLAHTFLEYFLRGPESLAALFGRPDVTLARLDALTKQRRVVAMAGADAHARIGLRGGGDPYRDAASLKMPSYESVFRTFAIRVQLDRPLSGRPALDALALRGALAAGHLYTAVDAFAAPPDLEFSARSGAFSARNGDDLVLGGPVEVTAAVNAPDADVFVLENGRRVAEGRGRVRYQAPERPAVFRAEVGWPGANGQGAIPWIVSNAIYAGGPVDQRRPAPRAVATRFAPVPTAMAGWDVERDQQSHATVTVPAPDTLDFQYALAASTADAYVALAHAADAVAAYDRLLFRASADGPMRLSVQLRVAGKDDQRWRRSVYVDRQPRDVIVYLDDVRPVGPTSSWTPVLAKVTGLLLVIDTTNARPGATGSVRIQNLRWAGP